MAFDLLAGEGQEGAQDCHVAALLAIWKRRDGFHAGEALEAGSAHHVKDQCLGIVVRMVRNDNCLIVMLLTQFAEPPVPQFPGRHFYAQAILRRIADSVEINAMHTHAVPLGPLRHKGLVAVALLPTKVEITMRDSETACPETPEPQVGQTHGVNASADC